MKRAMQGRSGSGRAVAACVLAAAACGWAAAADTRPSLETLQAQCIQEAMLRGVIGDGLKGYVDSCVKARHPAAPRDVTPQSTDTPAC